MNQYFKLIQNRSIRDVIDYRAEERPDAAFIVHAESGTVVSFAQAQQAARSVAAHITELGVEPGESVAYAMFNSADTALVILGILYGGFHATAINLVAGQETIRYVVEHSDAKLILCDETARALVDPATIERALPPRIATVTKELFDGGETQALVPLSAQDNGILMYTSGTTGRPKGVVLSHSNLLFGGYNACLAHELTDADRALCVLPLYHINGLCVTLLGPLVSGGSVVMSRKFRVSKFWDQALENKATWLSLVPTQISYLIDDAKEKGIRPQASIRFARSASAPLSPDVQTAFESMFGIPIVETMGLTETAAQVLSNPLPPGKRKIGSPGIAYGNEIIVADPTGQELPRGVEGEVLIRGPNVMREYLKNTKATEDTLNQEGWLRTGDLGRMDEDGYIFIQGRLKELIIKGGENIAPREIDDALYSNPDVIEAAAFAVPCPHYGEKVEAGVVLTAGSKIKENYLIAICVERVGSFKSPEKVHIFEELPKGPSGKIQRVKLLDLVYGSQTT